ncbi:MAG: hypothetical protein F7B59_00830 [Desulfurococcales archaeon]|nr:hypothetical protein [Desulfurococcales archaeon]
MAEINGYIVKLGGSVITIKDKKYKTDKETLCRIADYLRISKPLVIIHGGGSYGHYVVFSIIQEKTKVEDVDLPRISHTMDKLNHEVVQCLLKKGIPAVSFPPHSICQVINGSIVCSLETVKEAVTRGLIPVLYGDSILSSNGIEIVSGDILMVLAANELGIKRLYFLTDVDGLYEDLETKKIVRHLMVSKNKQLHLDIRGSSAIDVTGGMRAKIESLRNLIPGARAYILNGRKEDHLYKALIKGENPSTLIEVSE